MSTGERLAGLQTRDRDAHPALSAHVLGALFILLFLAILPGPGLQAQATDGEGLPRGTARATSGMGTQREPTPVDGASVTTGMLQSKIDEIAAASNLDEALKNKLNELYRRALSSLQAVKSYAANAAACAQAVETAPQETKEILARLAAWPAKPEIEPLPPDKPIREMEQRLAKEQADIAAVAAKLGEMEKALESWSRRPEDTRDRITLTKGKLEELESEIDRPPPPEESPLVTKAHRWSQEARQRELRAEILMPDQDLLSHIVREALLRARRDKSLRNPDAYAEALMVDMEEPGPNDLREKLLTLAEQRKDLLAKAMAADEVYLHTLGDLDHASSQLLDIVEHYDAYLAERLLWARSSPPVNLDTLSTLQAALGWLVSPRNWLETAQVLVY